jgi:hypothetical protein
MKSLTARWTPLGCLVLLGTTLLRAQQPAAAPPTEPAAASPADQPGPTIQFDNPVFDFDTVTAGDLVKHTFVFTNAGADALILTNVQPGCGCTTAGEWTHQVAPGLTGTIAVQFNSSSFNGPVLKSVTVTSNDKRHPSVALQIKGSVWRSIEMQPAFAMLTIPQGAETNVTTSLHITNKLDQPLTLSAPEINNKAFVAELKTNVVGKDFQVLISAVPPFDHTSLQGQLTLKTSSTNMPVLTASIWARVQPAASAPPPQSNGHNPQPVAASSVVPAQKSP